MKFKFKIQKYQTEAVEAVVNVFEGQPANNIAMLYRRDLGKKQQKNAFDDDSGYRNREVELSTKQLMENIQTVQGLHDIKPSKGLAKGNGIVNLDVEMETGTGKTYVYIKTMFELNRRFGWSKFIVVVPSIAIREGVAKSFRMLEEHFMEHYGRKARWFIYNSSNLNQLDQFSSDAGLNVMIINTQAFASSLKEGAKNKESRIIYSERDEFASRKPIDVIAANRPIIILDEPQKMGGAATQTALKRFNPLFSLYYSATHKEEHNTVYALDALDAYRQRLVKRIHVKGFEVQNLRGTNGYMYLESIVLSPNRPPQARLEIEVQTKSGDPRRVYKTFDVGTNLRQETELAEYDNYVISEIVPDRDKRPGYVSFTNGKAIKVGEAVGNVNELNLQRAQIRETIKSHFLKERMLFKRGIKCLSLFFIDEVAKYKSYDADGNEKKGVFQKIFEEEYARLVENEYHVFDEEYNEYLRRFRPQQVHNGYFSIDKKGRATDSEVKRGQEFSDDISAYDLILKNKERLLSFEEPTRFIFSHSALREGWDNPNVFQICTLRHSNSITAKRQEVGRGLRICVDKNGTRQDYETLGDDVHEINKLTVIANESYESFAKALQAETRAELRERPEKVTTTLFEGKTYRLEDGSTYRVTIVDAANILAYLSANGYIDNEGKVLPEYHAAVATETLKELPDTLKHIAPLVTKLVCSVTEPSALDGMIVEETRTDIPEQKPNKNFESREFQALWKEINHQYVYTVHYNSDELIEKAINHITAKLEVKRLRYVVTGGTQDAKKVDEFGDKRSETHELKSDVVSTVKYDLVGEIARGATLTRKSVVRILQGISQQKFNDFKSNPEEFIRKVINLIKEQKATMIVEHISYNTVAGKYDSDIFTISHPDSRRALQSAKHVTDYVVCDSNGERDFIKELDAADEVVVYAKLPRSFRIPTPVGDYAPDWAIAFDREKVRHIFFIAETKGSLNEMELRGVEKGKIECAKRLFNEMSTSNVVYHEVASFKDLRDKMSLADNI
jgi:type III restriction enzyme